MSFAPTPNHLGKLSFNEISENNDSVDQILDGLVDTALDRVHADRNVEMERGDEHEIRKTTRLLLLLGVFDR